VPVRRGFRVDAPFVEHIVRDHLARITRRGFDRGQDLTAKLESVLAVLQGGSS
jgi:hypothetical protein